MEYTHTILTNAEPARAWEALAAVTTYPQWTESMRDVTGLDGPDLAVGRRFRIRQPGLPTAVWRVIQVRDGETFTWENRTPGLHSVATHRVSRDAGGDTRITLVLRQTGALAGLIRLLTQARTRRYLTLEAAGVKAAAEAP
jgi:hypothetical protein